MSRKGKTVKSLRTEVKNFQSITTCFERFIEMKIAEGRAKNTIQKYRDNHTYFMEFLNLKKIEPDIKYITKEVIRAYIVFMLNDKVRFEGHRYKKDEEKTKGLSPSTVNTRIKTLRPFTKFLVLEGYLKSDPMKEIKDVKESEEKIDILTVDELRSLLNAPNQRHYDDFRDYCLITLLIDGYLRINEALTLRRTDLDLTSNVITIRGSNAKNRKARYVPIQKKTSSLLKELMKETEEFDSEYIFLSNYGERLAANQFRKQLRNYAKLAGIKKRIHPHLLRHTAATIALENGMDMRHLQMLLGHSDLRQVIRYTHLSNTSLIKQSNEYSALNNLTEGLNKSRKIKR
ncbi:tyrosine-type recombinase/integrase [Sutcliffiella cohnii]|uniref:tyrosine-type recombinase/integrase n=1 Tax=Sutcliffiella cohnii TaxID=33932 RepID=UPI002E1AC249|nr:tyrosine-type recombinase/integrase [Sutcliffiella cohnii]MED4016974.1 tyrosine-type recombinase/integrase [Sutcliffiella cohnii]